MDIFSITFYCYFSVLKTSNEKKIIFEKSRICYKGLETKKKLLIFFVKFLSHREYGKWTVDKHDTLKIYQLSIF